MRARGRSTEPAAAEAAWPGWLCTLAAAVALLLGAAALAAPSSKGAADRPAPSAEPLPAAQAFDRADGETIRQAARDILAQPRFHRQPSFWEWLLDKLGDWRLPGLDLDWGPGWGQFLMWFIILWCVLTLVAILIHFAWTLAVLLRGRREAADAARGKLPHFARLVGLSEAELEAMRERLLREGHWREAISVLMVLLLKRLDAGGVVRFHESKTNGDYVREFPPVRGGRDAFRRFVREFDATVYRGVPCDRRTYEHMGALFEACASHVR
jgi:hypothetical protein